MRRLVVWNVMTLDGYFEGKSPWDLDFHETVWAMLRLVSLGRIQRSFRCKPASCGSPSSIRCHGIRAPVWVCADVPHAAPGIMGHSSGWSSDPSATHKSAALS